MATYTSALVQIESIVTKALFRAKKGEDYYDYFLQHAYDGVRELNNDVIGHSIVWKKVTPDSINRIDFPQDMEKFIGLGIPYGGKIWFLTRKKDIIATYTEDDQGNLSLDANDGEGVALPTSQYEGMHSTGGLNLYGYFTFDERRREIVVNATSRDELILVYSTSGIFTDQIQYVPSVATEALIAFILWRDAEGSARTPAEAGMSDWRERRFINEVRKIKKRDFRVREFWDVLNETKSLFRR